MSIPRKDNKKFYDPQELIKCYYCGEKFPRAIIANHEDNCEEDYNRVDNFDKKEFERLQQAYSNEKQK